jgi:hypothetical protein
MLYYVATLKQGQDLKGIKLALLPCMIFSILNIIFFILPKTKYIFLKKIIGNLNFFMVFFVYIFFDQNIPIWLDFFIYIYFFEVCFMVFEFTVFKK